ncbi:hypothetical protein AB4236_20955, partial [Vibrio lentus]
VNDHQDDGVIRVWLALVLLCRVAASFNKAIKTTTNARHSRSELAMVFSVVYQHYRNALWRIMAGVSFIWSYEIK